MALLNGDLQLAEACAARSQDLSGLLLLYSSAGNRAGLLRLAQQSRDAGRLNVGFVASLLTGRLEDCLSLLVEHGRLPEATLMARTYLPSKVPEMLALWKADLKKTNDKAAAALADPSEYPNLFTDFDIALRVEEMFLKARDNVVSSVLYPQAKADLDLDLIALVKHQLAHQQQQLQQQQQQVTQQEVEQEEEEEEQEEEEPEQEEEEEPEQAVEPVQVHSAPASPVAQNASTK